NVKHGALAFGTDPHQVESITRSIRKITPKPLIIKLTPNVTDITSIAKAAENGGADAVSCINTLVGMVIDTKKKRPVFPGKTGGLSGPAIRPVGVAMTWKVAHSISIPVIGMGGIMNFDDALQYFMAGASAIQVGTGMFVDPALPERIFTGLLEYCTNETINTVHDIAHLSD
ncbi:MAG: dihydroorotate dehydrogenase, partial [Chitinivibrionales bacterium]|nr:dihydroorotate dehydrogenase [Chitinivibrionales bacterium]